MPLPPRSPAPWLSLLWIFACSSDDQTTVHPHAQAVSFLSFNTALGVGLAPYVDARLEAIERDLPGLAADVVCLQEVWRAADAERLSAALSEEYPYSHWSVRLGSGEAGERCMASEADALLGCLEENCADLDGQLLSACAILSCASDFTGVSSSCQDCVASNQTLPPAEIASTCADEAAAVEAYEDQNGLLLLSRWPLVEPSARAMISALGDRGILAARLGVPLRAPDGSDVSVDVLCSHLTPDFMSLPYSGQFGSWAAERDYHIGELLDFATQRADGGLRVLVGDMNTGPETPRAVASGPEAFATFVDAGYRSPYAESPDSTCTFCIDNPLVGAETDDGDRGAIIDHVLVANLPMATQLESERVLDQGLSLEVDGETVRTAYSDHYGVLVTLGASGP